MKISNISLENVLPEAFAPERERRAISDVWLKERIVFTAGNTYLVASASGGGKSSFCAYIYGSRSDYEGRILFDGTDIRSLKAADWDEARRTSLAWLPQDLGLFPTLSAKENILLKASQTNYKTEAQVLAMLDRLGLGPYADRPVRLLSLGQRQRVAAVRGLCQPFSFLLLDEPVSHLDRDSNESLSSLIAEEADSRGAAVIVTSVGNAPALDADVIMNL